MVRQLELAAFTPAMLHPTQTSFLHRGAFEATCTCRVEASRELAVCLESAVKATGSVSTWAAVELNALGDSSGAASRSRTIPLNTWNTEHSRSILVMQAFALQLNRLRVESDDASLVFACREGEKTAESH